MASAPPGLGNGEDAFLELLEPTDPNSAVARFLKSHGEGVYLVSFNVENLEEAVKQVRANGGRHHRPCRRRGGQTGHGVCLGASRQHKGGLDRPPAFRRVQIAASQS